MSKIGGQTIFIVKICLRVNKSLNSYDIQKIMHLMRIELTPLRLEVKCAANCAMEVSYDLKRVYCLIYTVSYFNT